MSFYQIGSARRAKNAAFFPLFTLLRDSSIVASLLLSTYFWVVYHSSYLSFARLEKCSDCHKVADHKSIKSRRLDLPPWFLKAFSHSYWPISMSYVLQVVHTRLQFGNIVLCDLFLFTYLVVQAAYAEI